MKLWATSLKNDEVKTSEFLLKSFHYFSYFAKKEIWDDNKRLNYRTLLNSKLNI